MLQGFFIISFFNRHLKFGGYLKSLKNSSGEYAKVSSLPQLLLSYMLWLLSSIIGGPFCSRAFLA